MHKHEKNLSSNVLARVTGVHGCSESKKKKNDRNQGWHLLLIGVRWPGAIISPPSPQSKVIQAYIFEGCS
jgi:hypothetical protein